jgi:hypothetical protein
MIFSRINSKALNARQKEAYNFQKISAALADYGFCTIRLSDDWQGSDFIAQHISGSFLKVQLKARLWFEKKYEAKDLWISFPNELEDAWYLYPHDELLAKIKKLKTSLAFTESWQTKGVYHFPPKGFHSDRELKALLAPYRLS